MLANFVSSGVQTRIESSEVRVQMLRYVRADRSAIAMRHRHRSDG
jgi:hypothetical protein